MDETESVVDWLRRNRVSHEWIGLFTEAFPSEAQSSASEAWCVEWAGEIDAFRFSAEDWIRALVRLEYRLKKAGARPCPLWRKLGYLHCAAMAEEQEADKSLSDIVDAMYLKYGFAGDSD